jgi:hypothetical protein
MAPPGTVDNFFRRRLQTTSECKQHDTDDCSSKGCSRSLVEIFRSKLNSLLISNLDDENTCTRAEIIVYTRVNTNPNPHPDSGSDQDQAATDYDEYPSILKAYKTFRIPGFQWRFF